LLVSALLPIRLNALLPRVAAITDALDAFDSKTRARQVERFRVECLQLGAAA
jgi:hypothetical protein